VRIAGLERIAEFASDYPRAENALDAWRNVVEAADWRNPAELKKTFGSASIVGDQTVFNIGGNKYRLISLIQYRTKIVLVQHVLTHEEYDRGAWKR
jgi:mRNA interferase HigB